MAWITAALTASSVAAKYAGDKKSQTAMDTMRSLERERQQSHQKTSDMLLGQTIEKSSANTAEQDIAEAAKLRQQSYETAQAPSAPAQNYAANQLGVSAGNKVVSDSITSNQRDATNYSNSIGKALSRLGGYTDQGLKQNIFNSRQLNQQANIGNYMQGSLGVLPIELEAANQKGDNMRTLGQILGAAGQVTGMMAAGGINPFAASKDAAAAAAAEAAAAAGANASNNVGAALNAQYANAANPSSWLTVPSTGQSWSSTLANGSFLPAGLPGGTQSTVSLLNGLNRYVPTIPAAQAASPWVSNYLKYPIK